jgi:uncharacterized membrane protein YdjX (TVP38/TMEM64 family)
MTRASRLRVVGLLALAAALVASLFFLPFNDYVHEFLIWVEDLGDWGLVFLAVFYVPATVLLIPGSLVTLAGGTLFGLVPATIAVSIGSTIGAAAAFYLGRTLARRWIESKVADQPKFRAIDQAIAAQGFKIVMLLRLSPVFPFTLLNYTLGLTRVSFRDYVLASWIGMLPGTVMYVYLGSTLANLAEVFSGTARQRPELRAFFFAGLVVTVLVTVYITRVAHKALSQTLAGTAEATALPAPREDDVK